LAKSVKDSTAEPKQVWNSWIHCDSMFW
jgi:hypothetical protein